MSTKYYTNYNTYARRRSACVQFHGPSTCAGAGPDRWRRSDRWFWIFSIFDQPTEYMDHPAAWPGTCVASCDLLTLHNTCKTRTLVDINSFIYTRYAWIPALASCRCRLSSSKQTAGPGDWSPARTARLVGPSCTFGRTPCSPSPAPSTL